ncbi:MAG TPA: trypsin-like peptidase domain-containing protein [Candidatus Woesebacteria bacterium]|nr:trypsin-like peptidase domain-containing protein [Candidatus Woesebacteria bacterium]
MQENRSISNIPKTWILILLFMIGAYLAGLWSKDTIEKPVWLKNLGWADQLWPAADEQQPAEISPLGELIENNQELTVPDIVEAASESVVTVSIKKQQAVYSPFGTGIFDLLPFGFDLPEGQSVEEVQQDIGTGFVVEDGNLVVTNKHVVSDTRAEYSVIDEEDNEYVVTNIYRDPVNDMAIIKVEGLRKPALPLGDSDKIRVGESVIAIGTALGEFRHTVTTGVVSGLGRGITAGNGFTAIEQLEGVIQTDAAINPGNSGGPLINARGEVIGVNVAVSQSAENIGFAIPINVIKSSLENFNQTGQFERPFLGVRYQMITQKAALANEVPQGAYIIEVTEGSTAADIGIVPGNIITKIGNTSLKDEELATILNRMKVGERIEINWWADGEEKSTVTTLKSSQ